MIAQFNRTNDSIVYFCMEIAVPFRNDDADHAVCRKSWVCRQLHSSAVCWRFRGVIEVGDIQSFIQYVKSFTQPIQQIAQVANMVQSTAAASERVFEFLEEEEEDQAVEHPADVQN